MSDGRGQTARAVSTPGPRLSRMLTKGLDDAIPRTGPIDDGHGVSGFPGLCLIRLMNGIAGE